MSERPALIIFARSWPSSDAPKDCKDTDTVFVFKKIKNTLWVLAVFGYAGFFVWLWVCLLCFYGKDDQTGCPEGLWRLCPPRCSKHNRTQC